jgi:hypothetical protein
MRPREYPAAGLLGVRHMHPLHSDACGSAARPAATLPAAFAAYQAPAAARPPARSPPTHACSYDGWLCLLSKNVREPAVIMALNLLSQQRPELLRWVARGWRRV